MMATKPVGVTTTASPRVLSKAPTTWSMKPRSSMGGA